MQIRSKKLIDIPVYNIYHGYEVDTEGNIWSTKIKNERRKLKTHTTRGLCFVCITNGHRHRKVLYNHKVVAEAFIPKPPKSVQKWVVSHIDGNKQNNRVDNLKWSFVKSSMSKVFINNEIHYILPKSTAVNLDMDLSEKIDRIHSAAIRKGLKVPETHEFITSLIESALNDYVRQYGLHKELRPIL